MQNSHDTSQLYHAHSSDIIVINNDITLNYNLHITNYNNIIKPLTVKTKKQLHTTTLYQLYQSSELG